MSKRKAQMDRKAVDVELSMEDLRLMFAVRMIGLVRMLNANCLHPKRLVFDSHTIYAPPLSSNRMYDHVCEMKRAKTCTLNSRQKKTNSKSLT